MIRVSSLTDPVTVSLAAPYSGVTITLRRLSTVDFARCSARAADIVRDTAALSTVITRHNLAETAADLNRALNDLAFQAGFAAWLASVECALAAVISWTGIVGEAGEAAPLPARLSHVAGVVSPADPADLAARITMETLLLDQAFERQLTGHIDLAARILVCEGNA
ncbi:MAG: hypothetical protein KF842_06765 [Caulobacter sp.]|nr:hypothetical protein [Caulobacter sp.]